MPYPGKVQIPHPPATDNAQMQVACAKGGGGGRDVEALNWSENYYKLSLWYFLWIIHQLYAVHWENITNCENTSWVVTTWIITTHQSEQHHYLQLHHLLNKQLQEFLRSQIKKKKRKIIIDNDNVCYYPIKKAVLLDLSCTKLAQFEKS